MSEYTTETATSIAARQRRRRAFITIGILVLGLFFAFWYALSYYEVAQQPDAAPSPVVTCRPYDPKALTPEKVTVNVLNATNRAGLAGRTGKQLEDRGFTVDKVANDPSKRATPAVAEVRYGAKGKAAAQLVLSMMPDGTKLVDDKRKAAVVDVALGTGFKALKPEVVASDTLPMCPDPSASPSATPSG